MIDLHAHILPGMDDGSRSAAESIAMLQCLSRQGVTDVAATPHFYAAENDPERFLERRASAWEKLTAQLPEDLPRIHLGAEVLFFEGINGFSGLHTLCIRGTDTLLLEMPFYQWNTRMLKELADLPQCSGLTVVLAHVERYLAFLRPEQLLLLRRSGLLFQANADFFCRFRTRRKALHLLQEGLIDVLGSDCHDLADRAPRMDEAAAYITSKLGETAAHRLSAQAAGLLPQKEGAAHV